jgi:hypothetical protein
MVPFLTRNSRLNPTPHVSCPALFFLPSYIPRFHALLIAQVDLGGYVTALNDPRQLDAYQKLFLRGVEGVEAKEVCDMLKTTETNLSVRLHRARERVRQAVDIYLEGRPLTV